MFTLQVILCVLLLTAIILLVALGPQIIFSIKHTRMITKMLDRLPCETEEDDDFYDIVEELCEDEAFLWRVHSQGKYSFRALNMKVKD
jgi:hypothetical protein